MPLSVIPTTLSKEALFKRNLERMLSSQASEGILNDVASGKAHS